MNKDLHSDIGLIGLAVMGQNLVLNMNDHGYRVSVFNRTSEKTRDFINGPAAETNVRGYESLEDFINSLETPRRIMIMVRAGDAVDDTISQLLPHMSQGDIIIDGGNSNFPDSIRRTKELEDKGFLFIGGGVSGGEEGARHGPSIMPGGSPQAWESVKEIFQAISAKVEDGTPCCDWVGENGAGHYVKMVHNGIEYGDMQVIAEAYHLLRTVLSLSHDELHHVFQTWNEGKLDSYLIEITRDIMGFRDANGEPLINKILDTAGQKGTGKWTAASSLDLGMPVTLVAEAVYARIVSALKEERVAAEAILKGPDCLFSGDKETFINDVRDALYASKIISYAQGFMLLREAAKEHKWDLNYGGIALMWRGGCIIRSAFLGRIKEAFDRKPELENLLLDPYFANEVQKAQQGWRRAITTAVESGIPVPAYSTALAFYDGYRSSQLPANLIQAQRDYFGAHTYERTDKPRGEFFHTNWTGRGGTTSSGTYEV